MEGEDIIVAVVAAAGGTLTGRVRLQKAVYLLNQLDGLRSRFRFEYYHYGPYSREVDSAAADAKAFNLLSEQYGHRQSDGAMFSIFTTEKQPQPDAFGQLGTDRVVALAKKFAATNVTVLELAATIDWLWRNESVVNWRAEVTKRKGAKVRDGRLERAVDLLNEIGLRPPAIPEGRTFP